LANVDLSVSFSIERSQLEAWSPLFQSSSRISTPIFDLQTVPRSDTAKDERCVPAAFSRPR